MPEELQIREMHAEDDAAVSSLVGQLGYQRTAEQIREWIADLSHANCEQAAYVACVDEQVVGWIEISIERRLQSPPFAMIGGLVVSDGYRGHGIGRLLCERAEQWAWMQGLETLRVTSRSTRVDAHRFYLRDGYREVKRSLVFEKQRPAKTGRP